MSFLSFSPNEGASVRKSLSEGILSISIIALNSVNLDITNPLFMFSLDQKGNGSESSYPGVASGGARAFFNLSLC